MDHKGFINGEESGSIRDEIHYVMEETPTDNKNIKEYKAKHIKQIFNKMKSNKSVIAKYDKDESLESDKTPDWYYNNESLTKFDDNGKVIYEKIEPKELADEIKKNEKKEESERRFANGSKLYNQKMSFHIRIIKKDGKEILQIAHRYTNDEPDWSDSSELFLKK